MNGPLITQPVGPPLGTKENQSISSRLFPLCEMVVLREVESMTAGRWIDGAGGMRMLVKLKRDDGGCLMASWMIWCFR